MNNFTPDVNFICLSAIYLIFAYHWFTEIKDQTIRNIPNLLIFLIGLTRLVLLKDSDWLDSLAAIILAAITPYVCFKLGGRFGGGTYKLLIASSITLGLIHTGILLSISPLLYMVYVHISRKFNWDYLPSGVSVLFMVPIQLYFLF